MPNFIPYDLNQSEMVVINYQDQLQPGTLEHAIHHLIEYRLDLTVFFPPIRMMQLGVTHTTPLFC